MKNFRQFTVTTVPFIPDLVTGVLWELDITGIEEIGNHLLVFAKEKSGTDKKEIESIISSLVNQNLLESFNVDETMLESIDWNLEWEKNLDIIEVTNKTIIKPTVKDYTPKEGQVIITIDPKMSFGTGEHQTTKLVLILLEKYVAPNQKVLDVGSGTGVLAIAAIKHGAESAIGIDNDEWCLENGKENIALNKVGNKVSVLLGEVDDLNDSDFDLILANINRHILLDIKDSLYSKLNPGGKIIISGILERDVPVIKESYQFTGLDLIDQTQMDEWVALVFIKQ